MSHFFHLMKPKKLTMTARARALGIHPRTLKAWQAAGAPIFDPQKLIEWRTARELGRRPGDPELRSLEKRKIALQCKRLEFQLEAEKGTYISLAEAEREVTLMCNNVKNLLRAKFENELPPMLEGLTTAEIQIRCKAALDEVCAVVNDSSYVVTGQLPGGAS